MSTRDSLTSSIARHPLGRRGFLKGSAAVAGSGLLLSGCGSDDDSGLTPVKLTLAYVVSAQFAGFLVAKDKGFYKDEGLNVTIQPGGTDVNAFQLLVAGGTDIGINTYDNLLAVRDSGANIVSVSQMFERSAQRLVYFADHPELADPANWKGKTISIFDGWQPTFAATVAKAGLSIDDIKVVKQTFDMNNFVNENVDLANAMIFNEYAQAIAGSNGRELALFDYGEYGTSLLEHCIAVTPEWAKKNKDTLVKFLRASMKGQMFARDNPEEAVAVVMKNGPALPEKYQTWQMNETNKLIWPSSGGVYSVAESSLAQTRDILHEFEVIKNPASADSVDFSFRDEAAKGFSDAELKGADFAPMEIDPYTYFDD